MCSKDCAEGSGPDGGVCAHHKAAAEREESRSPPDWHLPRHGDVHRQPRLTSALQTSKPLLVKTNHTLTMHI